MAQAELDDDVAEAQKIVKKFSWKAYAEDPDNDLAKSLVLAEARTKDKATGESTLQEQWMQLFQPSTRKALCDSQDESILAEPTAELSQAYKSFLKCLPKGHEARIEDGPPQLDVVAKAMKLAESTLRDRRETTKTGRMKQLFGRVAKSLHGHKELFGVVPSGDKYVSLVAGSVSAIIKATVNHDKISEGVWNALDDLNDDVAYWNELLQVHERDVLTEHYIARLYGVVFKFLATIMAKWSSKSSVGRLARSFDGNFFKDEIEDKKTKIRDLSEKLRRHTEIVTHRNTTNIIPKEELAEMIANSQRDAQAKFEARLELTLRQYALRLGQTSRYTLEDQARNQLWERRENGLRTPSAIGHGNSRTASPLLRTSIDFYQADQVRLDALQILSSFTAQSDILEILTEQTHSLNLNIEFFNRIQEWNAASTSQTLWFQGPFQAPQPSQYTLLSAFVIKTAQKADLPVIYYYCDSTTSIIDLLYTLLAQLVRLLPDDFESEKDFSVARFEALDKTADSADCAIALFKDLLDIGPYALFVVIDGLQMLDNSSNTLNMPQIRQLIQVLRGAGREENTGQHRVIKTLFTTDGFTDALTLLQGDERVSSDDFGCDDDSFDAGGIEVGFL